jgi:WD40 repeat protein
MYYGCFSLSDLIIFQEKTFFLIDFYFGSSNSVYLYDAIHFENDAPIDLFTAPEFCSSSFYIRTQFSPDGRFIASGSKDGSVYLWEVRVLFGYSFRSGHHNYTILHGLSVFLYDIILRDSFSLFLFAPFVLSSYSFSYKFPSICF